MDFSGESHTKALDEVVVLKENKYCFDCNEAKPMWASLGFGTVVCLRCAGYHRAMGTHITQVRSIALGMQTTLIIY